ncbi:FG-GAP repeat protein [Owenweeksia hongkongensis]
MTYRISLPLVFFIISFFNLKAQELTFRGDTAIAMDQLGWDVAMIDDFAVSVAKTKTINYNGQRIERAGSVYLHKKVGKDWVYQKRLTCSSPRPSDDFGRSVAISEKYLIVGAEGYDREPQNRSAHSEGAVFIYVRNGDSYDYKHELFLENAVSNTRFGEKVALGDDYLAVVCNYPIDRPDGKKSSGAVLVYKLSKRLPPQKIGIHISDRATSSMEYAIDIHGDLLVVGESGNRVSVYELEDESVKLIQELLPETSNINGFGDDVAISDSFIVMGTSGGEYDFYDVEFDSKVDSLYTLAMLDEKAGRFTMKYIQNNQAVLDSFHITQEDFRAKAKPYETWEEYSARKGGAGEVLVYKKGKKGFEIV